MKKNLFLLFILIIISCRQSGRLNNRDLMAIPQIRNEQTKNNTSAEPSTYPDSLNIHDFFDSFINNHITGFYRTDSTSYKDLCKDEDLKETDTANKEKYFSIIILHKLFTSETAANLSRGEILNIPYMWHWVNPNLRHKIRFADNKKLLKDTPPPPEFRKYNSYADIDRTPCLFLCDLLSETPRYYIEDYGVFCSFGWCSEREMAFVALMNVLGYNGKVIAEGNHSWSEFLITLRNSAGKMEDFVVKVDNTFDMITWDKIDIQEKNTWRSYFGNTRLSAWYNRKAHSDTELSRLKKYIVPVNAVNRIEKKTIQYLNRESKKD
jgi:hypothetical protein